MEKCDVTHWVLIFQTECLSHSLHKSKNVFLEEAITMGKYLQLGVEIVYLTMAPFSITDIWHSVKPWYVRHKTSATQVTEDGEQLWR